MKSFVLLLKFRLMKSFVLNKNFLCTEGDDAKSGKKAWISSQGTPSNKAN